MYDRTNIRSHWALLSYIDDPITSLRQRLAALSYTNIEPFLTYDPSTEPNGVETSYRHALNILHSLYAKLSTIYCTWENSGQILTDIEIRQLTIATNYDIYEAYLHLLKIGTFYLPTLRANKGLIDNFRNTLIDYIYRANASFPETFALGIASSKTPLQPGEKDNLYSGAAMPEIILEREFVFHQGTGIDIAEIDRAVNLRDTLEHEHPSVAKMLEFLRIVEITIEKVAPEDFATKSNVEIQNNLLTLLYTFGRWSTYTVATLLKDDQMLQVEYRDNNESISYRNYRDVQISNVMNPLIVTTTSIS